MDSRRSAVIEALRARVRTIEASGRVSRGGLPFGISALDKVLPEGGLAVGSLHEVAGGGIGAVDGAAAALFCRRGDGADGWHGPVVRHPTRSVRPGAAPGRPRS